MNIPTPVPVSEPPNQYHNGSTLRNDTHTNGYPKAPPLENRKIIAWDMEGMSLSGDDKPQHPVLFGCSLHTDTPLLGQNLSTLEMLNYIINVGTENRHAIHVGYHFNYDTNMLLRNLSENAIRVLWKKQHVQFKLGGYCWKVQYFPGKKFSVTRGSSFKRSTGRTDHTTVTIYDYSSFFGGQAFLAACENILRDDLSSEDRKVIEHGKAERGQNDWGDLQSVQYYWQQEISLIARVFRRFRDVMHKAGFALREWYGPGALANYINAARGIGNHISAVQVPTGIIPNGAHEASKIAFAGGRFEAFQIGYTPGPIYAVDVNNAYPHALRMIPSLSADNGTWKHVNEPSTIERFGFYHIRFNAPKAVPMEFRPMPLFWRDGNGLVSYPNHVEGWYASPEARILAGYSGVEIMEGWFFDYREEVFPWEFLTEMYDTRKRLGKQNLLSIPFKLGPNSLYGKYAQTVGWNEKTNEPPRWHALPIAAWITSMCRAMLWSLIRQVPDKVIAVETDSAFLTVDPSTLSLDLGDGLGQWSREVYDAIVYLQSGMYMTKRNGEWSNVRSRGILRTELDPEGVLTYLRTLQPNSGHEWEPYRIVTKPRFVGMGAALAGDNFNDAWRTWERQSRDISFGESGKRRHHQQFCRQCEQGTSPVDGPHRTFIFSGSDGETMSHPRRLPWERAQLDTIQRFRETLLLEKEQAVS